MREETGKKKIKIDGEDGSDGGKKTGVQNCRDKKKKKERLFYFAKVYQS